MKRKTRYTNEPLGKLEIIDDFLPPPEELVFRKEKEVEVKLRLRKSSLDFYKKLARASKSRHEGVMRRLLDRYASTYRNKA